MRLLIDTQAFLFFIAGDRRMGVQARTLIESTATERLFSIASVWEIAIKVGLGKLTLAQPLDAFLSRQLASNAIALLPIAFGHAIAAGGLPLHHRDPFDRMLVAQSMVEGVPIVSGDTAFDHYGIERIW